MTRTSSPVATTLAAPTRWMIPFAEMMMNDIDEAKWADRFGTTINHPAFILGHTGYYAGVCMQMLGGDIELGEDEEALYAHGRECTDDASMYPGKADSIAAFNERITIVSDFMEGLDDAVLHAPSDEAWFAEFFPTMGGGATFMMIGHITFHLGQLSAWRRIAGMGPAM